jgi:hypothetical protein
MTKKVRYVVVALVGLCVGLGLGAVADGKSPFGPGSPRAVPGQFRESLSGGRWNVYEMTGIRHGRSIGSFSYRVSSGHAPALTPSMITVTGPGGRGVPVTAQPSDVTETLQKGGDTYTAVADFDAPRSGTYSVAVASPGQEHVLLARPFWSGLAAFLPWAGGALAGALCFLIGLILLIVEYRRGSAGRPAATPPGTTPPGTTPPGTTPPGAPHPLG